MFVIKFTWKIIFIDAKKAGYKGGVEGTGTNVVQKEETVAEHHEKDADGNVIEHPIEGEENLEETKVDKVRRLLAMQETFEKDREELKVPTSPNWRDRLGLQEEATPEQLKKRAKLQDIKKLTNAGKHKEASDAFKKEFPNF